MLWRLRSWCDRPWRVFDIPRVSNVGVVLSCISNRTIYQDAGVYLGCLVLALGVDEDVDSIAPMWLVVLEGDLGLVQRYLLIGLPT